MSVEAVHRKSGRVWRVRWRDANGQPRSRIIGRKADAELFNADITRRRRLGQLADHDGGRETLGVFVERWWSAYAVPNLAEATLHSYAALWDRYIGDYPQKVRQAQLPIAGC